MRKRRYRITELLGRGGFGSVYKAEKLGEEGFSTVVAVKLLHAMGSGGSPAVEKARSDAVRRLRDEARLLGLLEHRAIVRVYDLERLRGEWAIVMEYVDGIQLAELVELTRVPVRQAVAIIEEVADALHTAFHFEPSGQKLRLLHRDIKPSNIMISRGGSIKVLDFGIARADFESRESQTAGFLIGTQRYMSPEHLDYDDDTIQVGPESDIYSLGAVLFELLAHKPFGRATLDPLLHQDKVSKLLDEHILGRVPHALYQLLERMLSFAPGVRPTALELRTACEDLQAQLRGESLRAWCERVVVPVVGNRPKPKPGRDPLLGTIIEEGELPDEAFLDAFDRTAAAPASPPSTYELGDTWGERPEPKAPAPPVSVHPAQPMPPAGIAGAIALEGERDGPVARPVGIETTLDQPDDEAGGVAIAIDGEGDWEPRPPRRRPPPPSTDEASDRRLVLLGGGLGVLAVVVLGIWGTSRLLDTLERGPAELEEPPALVEAADAAASEPEPEPEAPVSARQPAPARQPTPVAAHPAPAPPPRASSPEPAAPSPPPEPEAPVVVEAPAPEAPVVAPEPEAPDNADARLAAIAALRGAEVTPAEATVAEQPAEGPAVADAAVAEPEAVAVEEPTVAEAPPEPPPPPAPGSYRVQGNAIEVYLKSGGRRFEAGAEMDPGRYDIWALFDRSPGAAPIRVGVARVQPGATVTIDCDAGLTLCRPL